MWWHNRRNVSVVVDNDSWILPFAHKLVTLINQQGHNAKLCREHNEILSGGVAFFLGCVHIAPAEVLALNYQNLLIHESDLPKGKGFAPLSWQVLNGESKICFCLLAAAEDVDAGNIIYKDYIYLTGNELNDELRNLQGHKTLDLCMRYLDESLPKYGDAQMGESSFFKRRRPQDSELNMDMTIREQFNLLRIVDNERYPAFFYHNDEKYILQISKASEVGK